MNLWHFPHQHFFSIPTSRNAFDRVLPSFHNGLTSSLFPSTCPRHEPVHPLHLCQRGPCDLGAARREGGGGQPCLWWSQGCSIGCPYCLTDPRQTNTSSSSPSFFFSSSFSSPGTLPITAPSPPRQSRATLHTQTRPASGGATATRPPPSTSCPRSSGP